MRCPTSCTCLGNSSHLMDEPPVREGENPGALSLYQRFWSAATPWTPFILPHPWQSGPAMERTQTQPGTYEFAVSMPQAPSTLAIVYLGQSSNVRNRHLTYTRTQGDHLKDLMEPMVAQGHTIWQRVRYLKTPLQAQRWEARFLVDYDYAWNSQLNPKKRNVRLEYRNCCCCAVGVDVISPAEDSRVSLLSAPLQSCTGFTWKACLVLQTLVAITIICIVAVQLSEVPQGQTSQCLLGVDSHGNSLCIYTYVMAGMSSVISLILAIVVESASKKSKLGHGLIEAFISACLAILWAIAAVVLTRYSFEAKAAGQTPKDSFRTSVWILSWIESGLWIICVAVKTSVVLLRCCASSRTSSSSTTATTTGVGGGGGGAYENSISPVNGSGSSGDGYGYGYEVAYPPSRPPLMPMHDSDNIPPASAPSWTEYPQQQFMAASTV